MLRTTLYGQLWSASATAFSAPVSASSRPRFAAFVARALRCENLDRAASALSRPAGAPRRDDSLDERPEGMRATSAVRAADAALGHPRLTRWRQHHLLRNSSGTGLRNLVSF